MPPGDLLTYLGVSPPLMFAGLCGGVVNIYHFHRTKPREFVGAIVCGALTANFLGSIMAKYTGDGTAVGVSFLIGWWGLKWVAGVIKRKFPSLLFEDPDGKP